MRFSPPAPCSALALDIGRRRIGLAGCDGLGISITPLPALRRAAFEKDLHYIHQLACQRRVRILVVGLPLDHQQRPTPQATHCRRYGLKLARRLANLSLFLPVAWVNEHCSTWCAGEHFSLHGDRSGKLDSKVAYLLLAQWLREGPQAEPVTSATTVNGSMGAYDPP